MRTLVKVDNLQARIAALENALVEERARGNYAENGCPLDWEDMVLLDPTWRDNLLVVARAELVEEGLLPPD